MHLRAEANRSEQIGFHASNDCMQHILYASASYIYVRCCLEAIRAHVALVYVNVNTDPASETMLHWQLKLQLPCLT